MSVLSEERAQTRTPAWLVPVLCLLLFCSGACALVYQVLWLRLLSLTFGVTTYAASTVLASFMGGLALGSLLAGRMADRARNPLRLFGMVECLIGLCAVVTPVALAGVHHMFVALSANLSDSVALATLIRFLLAVIVLIVPTALMGATLPIVVKSSLARLDGVGSRVGALYATNTSGAIAGTLLAGFFLIPTIGMTRSFYLAASVNVAVGLVAIVCSRRQYRSANVTAASAPLPDPATPKARPSRVMALVVAVFAISGFASLALEVIWFRVFVIFLGPTSYSFTVMLAAVLVGIALGSAIITPFMRWRRADWLQVLALLQMGAALVALQSFSSLRRTPKLPEWVQGILASYGLEFAAGAIAVSAIAIVPTALFFGMAFPVGLRLWAGAEGTEGHTAERIGLFYSLNVCGAVLGSILAGFWLLPTLGSRMSLIAMAGLFLASGFALQAVLARRRPIITILTALAAFEFVSRSMAMPDPLELARLRLQGGGRALFQEEGVQTTVSVVGDIGTRVLYLDGRHQANDSASMIFIHGRIGLLPAVLHPAPRRALVVGLGGGVTPGALAQYPGLTVDVVELSESVIHGAAYFSHANFDVLRNPNVRVRSDDGRNFLLRAREPYDVITADAILPQHAGANNLNSVEYFRLVRSALTDNGIALHWNGGETATQHKLILRAFVAAFPDATLWGDGTLMVGTKHPMTLSQGRIEALLAAEAPRRALGLMNVDSFDRLLRMFRAGPDDIRVYVGDGPVLSDDKPALEYFASLVHDAKDLSKIPRNITRVVRP